MARGGGCRLRVIYSCVFLSPGAMGLGRRVLGGRDIEASVVCVGQRGLEKFCPLQMEVWGSQRALGCLALLRRQNVKLSFQEERAGVQGVARTVPPAPTPTLSFKFQGCGVGMGGVQGLHIKHSGATP